MGRPRKVVTDDPNSSDTLYPLGEDVEELGSIESVDTESTPVKDSVYVPKTPYNTELLISQGKKVCSKCGGQLIHSINNEPRCNEGLGMECPSIKDYHSKQS